MMEKQVCSSSDRFLSLSLMSAVQMPQSQPQAISAFSATRQHEMLGFQKTFTSNLGFDKSIYCIREQAAKLIEWTLMVLWSNNMDLKMVLSARFPGVHAVRDFAKKLSTHHWITMWDEKDQALITPL